MKIVETRKKTSISKSSASQELDRTRLKVDDLDRFFGYEDNIGCLLGDNRGVPSYYGRKDIAAFLTRIPLSAIPWKKYKLN